MASLLATVPASRKSASDQWPFFVRPATEADRAMICSDWLRSYQRSAFAARISRRTYFDTHKLYVNRAIERCLTIVAVPDVPDPGDEAAGWICGEREEGRIIVHYAYTKKVPYRGHGVQRCLLRCLGYERGDKTEIVATHATPAYFDLRAARVRYGVTYNPYPFLERFSR